MSDPAPASDLLTMPETAAMVRKPIGTMRHWRKRGYGPRGFRVGRHVMYDRSDVEAFLETCRSAGVAERP